MKEINIIVNPVKYGSAGRLFHAYIASNLVAVASPVPFLEAARTLLAKGTDPHTVISMYHQGSDTLALRSTVGKAARLATSEGSNGTPRFRVWRPFNK